MARLISTSCLMTLLATLALAQDDAPDTLPTPDPDLTLPPRIQGDPPPGDTVLEPAPEDREDMLEAVVTGGQTDFNLPDLGTSFRRDQEEYDPNERIDVSFLNLYDPDNRDPAEEAFPSLDEQLGRPTIRIFEIRIGSKDDVD